MVCEYSFLIFSHAIAESQAVEGGRDSGGKPDHGLESDQAFKRSTNPAGRVVGCPVKRTQTRFKEAAVQSVGAFAPSSRYTVCEKARLLDRHQEIPVWTSIRSS